MPNYKRLFLKGGTYFFTVVTFNRSPMFNKEANINLLRKCFHHIMVKHPFTINAIAILPDHVHTLWTLPENDADYSMRWQLIKRSFSQHYSEQPMRKVSQSIVNKQEKGIWQRRFWEHAIRSQEDFNQHCDYIHYNPVKHRLVTSPHEWEHSSFRKFVSQGLYPENWGQNIIKELEDTDYE